MKKILLSTLGLSALLASCNISVVDDNSGAGGLALKSLTSFTTNHRLAADVTDANTGAKYSKGTYVICDNKNTVLTTNLTWRGGLSKLYVQFKGIKTGETVTTSVEPYTFSKVSYAGKGSADFNMGPGMAPLSLGQQAIVIEPVYNVNVKGGTYVRLQGADVNGIRSNIVESVNVLPVMNCY